MAQVQTKTKRPEPNEAIGDGVIKDARPGTTKTASLHFDDLGSLEDFPETVDSKDEEGSGTQCVVLTDILVGAEGNTYTKGQIQRISKLVHGYFDKDKEPVKAQIRRLVNLGAIRHATPDEIEAGFAVVTVDSESESTQNERAKRMELEKENADLRAQLGQNQGQAKAPETDTDPFEEGK